LIRLKATKLACFEQRHVFPFVFEEGDLANKGFYFFNSKEERVRIEVKPLSFRGRRKVSM
jgi:hypothetical protein